MELTVRGPRKVVRYTTKRVSLLLSRELETIMDPVVFIVDGRNTFRRSVLLVSVYLITFDLTGADEGVVCIMERHFERRGLGG